MQFILDLRSSGQAHIEIAEGMEEMVHAKHSGAAPGPKGPDATVTRADLPDSCLGASCVHGKSGFEYDLPPWLCASGLTRVSL